MDKQKFDTQEFLKQWRALMAEARKGEGNAISLLANAAASAAYLLERLADDKETCEVVRAIAAQRDSWPILFTGIRPSNDKLFRELKLGANLPFIHDQHSRFQMDELGQLVMELVRKVIEAGRLYRYFQSPQCPEELKVDLPDYAQSASGLKRLDADSFEDWWRCVEAEFDWEDSSPPSAARAQQKQRIRKRLADLAQKYKKV